MEPKDHPFIWLFGVILAALIGAAALIYSAHIQAERKAALQAEQEPPKKVEPKRAPEPPVDEKPFDKLPHLKPIPKREARRPLNILQPESDPLGVNIKTLEDNSTVGTEFSRWIAVVENETDSNQTISEVKLVVKSVNLVKIINSTLAAHSVEFDLPSRTAKLDGELTSSSSFVIDKLPQILKPGEKRFIPYRFSVPNHPRDTIVEINGYFLMKLSSGYETTSTEFKITIHPDSPRETFRPAAPKP